jgi:NitT/TauT family transport system substrate-binding protein
VRRNALVATLLVAAACGTARPASAPVELRLGYFPNLTHATAIAGLAHGDFAKALGPGVKLTTQTFNAGPAAVEALFSNGIDAAFVGPNPAVNAYAKSNGTAIRVIAGATSGGASLVVQPSISSPADLKGRKLASPQLGNTQDVALRTWLKANGLTSTPQGTGDVQILPQDNAQTLDAFRAGQIDGAWVPEPWATRLVRQGGGKVLVDERSLWPAGRFTTTLLVVRTAYLTAHPDVVRSLLRGEIAANAYVNEHADDARRVVNAEIAKLTGKALPDAIVSEAWSHMTFTLDPVTASLRAAAANASALGLVPRAKLDGIFDLKVLNALLTQSGLAAVPL